MGTRDEWLDDGSTAGGIGTITRPAADPSTPPQRTQRPRPAQRPRARPGQAGRPQAQVAPPRRADESTRPRRAAESAPPRAARAARSRSLPRPTQRMPFILLLCGLLGGALISALVISTTLAQGSFQITRLQQANDSLARQRQLLQEQVATAQSAAVIQSRALQLGMRPVGELRFINLKTGKVQTDAGRGAVANIHVPGYTP